MQNKLAGVARKWYDNLTSYDYMWGEWKRLLIDTFPEHQDYASTLRKMLNYCKNSSESWERYFFKKMDLIHNCHITGRDAVSCVIYGIKNDPNIQIGARAGRYQTSDVLYGEYLSTLQIYGNQPMRERPRSKEAQDTLNKCGVINADELVTWQKPVVRISMQLI